MPHLTQSPEQLANHDKDDERIKLLVARLSRPHSSGGLVIERAAILADGGDFSAVMDWITAHAGRADTTVAPPTGRGLHGSRVHGTGAAAPTKPLRFLLPANAVE
jgi:transcription termination factor Rho